MSTRRGAYKYYSILDTLLMLNLIRKNIPNALTCANLFCGCVGIAFAFKGGLDYAAYTIFISAIFDFLDGFAARLLNAYSIIGKELDSLADVVSFGVLPGAIIYGLFLQTGKTEVINVWLNYVAFLVPVFSALRLAKFNTDERQVDYFIGLPTPANAILIASFPIIINSQGQFYRQYLLNRYLLIAFVIIMCSLLVLEVPMMSLKFKTFHFGKNIYRYLLILLSIFLLLFFKFAAIPAIIFVYIILSIFQFKLSKNVEIPG